MKTIEKAKLAKRSESVQQTQAEMNGRPIYTEMDAEFFGLNNGNTVGNSTKKQDSLFSKQHLNEDSYITVDHAGEVDTIDGLDSYREN